MSDFKVTGADAFAKVARDLKAAGDKKLQRDLYRGLERAAKPIKRDIQQAAATKLPQRGGLAAYVAGMKIRTQRSVTAKGAAIRLIGSVETVLASRAKTEERRRKAAERAYERRIKAQEDREGF